MAQSHTAWLLICNPENRRKQFFTDALQRVSCSPPVIIVSYNELLSTNDILGLLRNGLGNLGSKKLHIKIESPGENFPVEKALVCRGASADSKSISEQIAKTLQYQKGRFRYLKYWYVGYSQLLLELREAINIFSRLNGIKVKYLNEPECILKLIDKYRCQQHLVEQNISTPKLIGSFDSLDELIDSMTINRHFQVFVKTRYGSSASGLMALRVNPKNRAHVAYTSMEIVRVSSNDIQCFNSLKIKRYTDINDIKVVFNAIMQEGGYVEDWISKPKTEEGAFDFRILVINGKPLHTVTRCSSLPITNLHLGNQRGDITKHPNANSLLRNAKIEAAKAAAAFSECRNIGIDVLSNGSCARVIEMNAYGDLLPGIEIEGLSAYDYQIKEMYASSF
jgi:glutathione synthase/RimK-type ligase-like ATP-grasp enzyme